MGVLHMLSKQGDVRVEWDAEKEDIGDPEALAAIAEAERILAEARREVATAFAVREDGQTQVMEEFDRTAKKVVVVPRIVGG